MNRCKTHNRADCSTCRRPASTTSRTDGDTYVPPVTSYDYSYGSGHTSSSSCDSSSSGSSSGGDC